MSEHDSPTGYSQKSADGIAETTCPHCGSSQVSQHPVTGEWTCLYCRAHWTATRTAVVSVGDENAPRGTDIATGRVFVCPNCGGTQLKQDGYTGKWLCLDCRNEFLDVDARMVVVDAATTIRKNDLVVDTANLLSDAQEADLLAYLRSIESQLVVAVETVNTITENVEYYARRRAQELGVGRDDIDNGVYIVVVLNPRRIQIVAGNGVASKIDATQLDRISSQIIAPKLKAGDYVAGFKRGVAEMLRLYTSPANSAEASAAKPNGGGKEGARLPGHGACGHHGNHRKLLRHRALAGPAAVPPLHAVKRGRRGLLRPLLRVRQAGENPSPDIEGRSARRQLHEREKNLQLMHAEGLHHLRIDRLARCRSEQPDRERRFLQQFQWGFRQ